MSERIAQPHYQHYIDPAIERSPFVVFSKRLSKVVVVRERI
jgi:hypothetical protein